MNGIGMTQVENAPGQIDARQVEQQMRGLAVAIERLDGITTDLHGRLGDVMIDSAVPVNKPEERKFEQELCALAGLIKMNRDNVDATCEMLENIHQRLQV